MNEKNKNLEAELENLKKAQAEKEIENCKISFSFYKTVNGVTLFFVVKSLQSYDFFFYFAP